MSAGFTNLQSIYFLVPLIDIAVFIIIIIVTLDCIWRVDKQFKAFLKLLLLGFVLETLKMIARTSGFNQSPSWNTIVWVSELLSGFVFLIALFVLYRMIRMVNHEKSKK